MGWKVMVLSGCRCEFDGADGTAHHAIRGRRGRWLGAVVVALALMACSPKTASAPGFFVDSLLDFDNRTLRSGVVHLTLDADFGDFGIKSYAADDIIAEGEKSGYKFVDGKEPSGSCDGAHARYAKVDAVAGVRRQFIVYYNSDCAVVTIALGEQPQAL